MSARGRRAAEAALAKGDLDAARSSIIEAVREEPGDPALRAFLFQLSSLMGDWPRARNQLDILLKLNPATADFIQDYRLALAAEEMREAVWAGRREPPIFGEPKLWLAQLVGAISAEAEGRSRDADALRRSALTAAPALAGRLDEEPFAWIGDSDNRLGPTLEVVIDGGYHWLPFEHVVSIEFSPPRDLRDYVWTVGVMTLVTGAALPVMIPTRYPGAALSGDAMIRAGRKTEWRELEGGLYAGAGQRVLSTEAGDHALMDIRTLTLDHPPEAEEAALPADAHG